MYVALARTVWTDVDKDKISDEVRKFRARYPEYSRDQLVDRLIEHTAVRCGVIAAVASAPPGFLAVLPLAADFSYQVLALNRLVLTIARIYGRSTTREQRAAIVAVSLALGGGAEFVRRNVVKGISNALKRQNEARIVPHVGGAVGSLLSYGAIRTVGKLARNYYRPKGAASRMRALANR
ncbi:MAG TPA: hypothetical protein VIY96_03270 [Thermoanaerobaculia bacterium]